MDGRVVGFCVFASLHEWFQMVSFGYFFKREEGCSGCLVLVGCTVTEVEVASVAACEGDGGAKGAYSV